MSDFILNALTNSGSLLLPKFDATPIPVGANLVNYISGSDWNTVAQALVDIRNNITSGSLIGFGARYSAFGAVPNIPALYPVGGAGGFNNTTSDYVYVNTAGALTFHNGQTKTDFILAAAAASVQYSQYSELNTLTVPIQLPVLAQGSVILYVKNNVGAVGSRRSQLVARWGTDNSDTIIAEGPPY